VFVCVLVYIPYMVAACCAFPTWGWLFLMSLSFFGVVFGVFLLDADHPGCYLFFFFFSFASQKEGDVRVCVCVDMCVSL